MNKGIHLGLGRITSLLRSLGDPHLATPIIHVAGTNGKGSVCAYLESIFRRSGLRVGRFISPHLVEVRDCISVKGQTISRPAYDEAKKLVEDANSRNEIQASSFELLTATAYLAFQRETRPPLDLAIIEVGMGGTTDATNLCPNPLATVITPIDMDHQAFLGNTPAEIASVKAGIIKRGVPCVVSPQKYPEAMATVQRIAASQEAPLIEVTPARQVSAPQTASASHTVEEIAVVSYREQELQFKLPLKGSYQLVNVATAVAAVQAVAELPNLAWADRLTPEAVKEGIETTRWPGRLDWLEVEGRQILLDGAHNPASIQELQSYLASLPPRPTTLVCSVSAPRDPSLLLDPLLGGQTQKSIRQVIAVPFTIPEGMPWVKPVELSTIVEHAQKLHVKAHKAATVAEAIQGAPPGRLVICGSLYLVSDVYRLVDKTL